MSSPSFTVVGAGVIGLSTALTLHHKFPSCSITILAKHFPGDYDTAYCSPWAGANWCSSANDNGLLESFDLVTFHKFEEIVREHPEAGIAHSALRMIFDQERKNAGILSQDTGRVWYDRLVGGLVDLDAQNLPEGAVFGVDVPRTFVINTQVYLQWLLANCRDANITLLRQSITHINEAFDISPESTVTAVFNCTGLGSYHLGGIEDTTLYPTRGQTVLIEQPIQPLTKMYFRSPSRVNKETTYVFQRPLAGGIVLGGSREDGNWNGEADLQFATDIMRRCCALAPELGRPDDLKVIRHGVGLRPNRKGGPRIEVEIKQKGLVVHNYGASGAGYQASWGMAEYGVRLLCEALEKEQLKSKI